MPNIQGHSKNIAIYFLVALFASGCRTDLVKEPLVIPLNVSIGWNGTNAFKTFNYFQCVVDTKRDKKFIDSLALNTNNILYATVDAELPSGVLMIQTAELRKWWQGYMVVKINVLSQDSEQISTVEVQLPERASIVYYIATKRPISGGYVSPRNITKRELVP